MSAGAVSRASNPEPPTTASGEDAAFAAQLEARGLTHRVVVGALALLVMLLGAGLWPAAIVGPYLVVAGAALLSARRRPRAVSETPLGMLLLVMDVVVVEGLGYAWGTSSSPIVWMSLPLVLGWTLVTRRSLGRVVLVAVLLVTGALLVLEQLGHIPTAPARSDASWVSGQARLFFFGSFALALTAAHVLVSEIMARLRVHASTVSRLEGERRIREKEDELALRLDQSQRLQALGRLAGGVAHDFNNVLMGLSGLTELAELRLERDPEAARRFLQDMLGQIHRASLLTTQLLDYARERPREPVATDVAALLHERKALLDQLVRKRLELRVHSEPACWVHIDPSELSRLLLSLAANAFDAARDQGKLHIRVRRHGDHVRLSVRDDGAGIAAEHLPRVFDPFFTTKPFGEAAGLGLSAVYGIVRRSDGTLDLQSRPGEGTTVTVVWPAAEAPTESPPQREEIPPQSQQPLAAAPKLGAPLLVVDDDEAVRAVVQAQLEAAGYQVEVAESPAQAVEALHSKTAHHYAMLVTDVVMPGMTGPQLAREFNRLCPAAPVLLISGYAEDALDDETGHHSVLSKPFSAAQLLRAVEQRLAAGRAHAG